MSKVDVLKAFLARESRGLPLNHAAVLRDDRRLHAATLRIFGQWDQAMQACGITPSRVRCHRRWSRQRVIERIAELACLGRPLNVRAIQISEATLAVSKSIATKSSICFSHPILAQGNLQFPAHLGNQVAW